MEQLAVSLLAGFLTVLIGGPYARKYLLASGLYGIDQQKEGKPKIATSGGLLVLFGFIVSVTGFLGLSQFIGAQNLDNSLILSALSSVTIIALIGLIDDIHIKKAGVNQEETSSTPTEKIWSRLTSRFNIEENGSQYVERAGIGQLPKMLFVLPAAFPLIGVGAGSWTMHFPIVGTIHWGIIYPLVLLPLGLLFVSNVVNMLAGTNGLSAGMSLIASSALGLYALINGRIEAAIIALSLAASLLAFMKYNFYPASILPGDSLTYLCGAALFSAMVIGNIEKFGVFIFAPYFVEFFLKLRSGFKAHSWGKLQPDGSLESQHDKIYSLTHPFMKLGFNEKQITLSLVGIEIIVAGFAFLIFSLGLF